MTDDIRAFVSGDQNVVVGDVFDSSVDVRIGTDLLSLESIRPRRQLALRPYAHDSVRRQALLDEFAEFVATHDRGYFVVEAPGGYGKTTFLVQAIEEHHGVLHLGRNGDNLSPSLEFLASIDAKLPTELRLGSVVASLPGDSIAALISRQVEVLASESQASPVVVGLDLAPLQSSPSYAAPYGLPSPLPRNTFVVLATRPGLNLQVPDPRRVVSPDSDRAVWESELEAFVLSRLPAGADRQDRASSIVARSHASWLLAELLTEADRDDARSGIASYLAGRAAEIDTEDGRAEMASLLGCLAVVGGAVSLAAVDALVASPRREWVARLERSAASTFAFVDTAEEVLALRHEVMAEVLLAASQTGLLASECRVLEACVEAGRQLIVANADRLLNLDLTPDVEAVVLLVSGRWQEFDSLVRFRANPRTKVLAGEATTISSEPQSGEGPGGEVAGSAYLNQVRSVVRTLWPSSVVEEGTLAFAELAISVRQSELTTGLLSLGAGAAGALLARGLLTAGDFGIAIEGVRRRSQLLGLVSALRAEGEFISNLEGWTHSSSVEGLERSEQLTEAQIEAVEALTDRLYDAAPHDARLEFVAEMERHVPPPRCDWTRLAAEEADDYLAVRLLAIAIRSGAEAGMVRADAARRLAALLPLQRTRCLARLWRADPSHDLWRELLADELGSARASALAPLRARVVLEVALVAPRSLAAVLAEEAIEVSRNSPLAHWRTVALGAMPLVSAGAIRAIAAAAAERMAPERQAALLARASRNGSVDAVMEALSWAQRLPSGVRAVATVPLALRAADLGAIPGDAELQDRVSIDIAEMEGHALSTELRIALRDPLVRDVDWSPLAPDLTEGGNHLPWLAMFGSALTDEQYRSRILESIEEDTVLSLQVSRVIELVIRQAPVDQLDELIGMVRSHRDQIAAALLVSLATYAVDGELSPVWRSVSTMSAAELLGVARDCASRVSVANGLVDVCVRRRDYDDYLAIVELTDIDAAVERHARASLEAVADLDAEVAEKGCPASAAHLLPPAAFSRWAEKYLPAVASRTEAERRDEDLVEQVFAALAEVDGEGDSVWTGVEASERALRLTLLGERVGGQAIQTGWNRLSEALNGGVGALVPLRSLASGMPSGPELDDLLASAISNAQPADTPYLVDAATAALRRKALSAAFLASWEFDSLISRLDGEESGSEMLSLAAEQSAHQRDVRIELAIQMLDRCDGLEIRASAPILWRLAASAMLVQAESAASEPWPEWTRFVWLCTGAMNAAESAIRSRVGELAAMAPEISHRVESSVLLADLGEPERFWPGLCDGLAVLPTEATYRFVLDLFAGMRSDDPVTQMIGLSAVRGVG